MKKLYLLGLFCGLLTIGSCQNEREMKSTATDGQETEQSSSLSAEDFTRIPAGAAIPGEIIIKINEQTEKTLLLQSHGEVQMNSVPSAMGIALNGIRATKVSRLFPPAGKFEERSRAEGMHLWFTVRFDEQIEVGRAMQALKSVDGVESVEFCPVIQLASAPNRVNPVDMLTSPMGNLDRFDKLPFNDPMLKNQWHYNNVGSNVPSGVMGCDVNLFNAWKVTTGTPNVIVCIVDGGIDIDHPDLIDNLWVNEAEKNGVEGKDDDDNGYIDDIHGYCFVTDQGNLRPDEDAHGTHVAGTVAARNNNNVGVAGIAGGDGSPETGVRLMSAAIFREGARGGSSAAAIKYGADNGAVISQNSWGYPYASGVYTTPPSTKAAIDYFTKYAGTDANGNQLPNSPMKGGVVLFAAGNDGREYTSQPAAYEGCIAVSAIGPNFKKAFYSNYGDWVDISAPGGDQKNGYTAGVLSTTDPNAQNVTKWYDYYHGTSMACPHVSGVAALVVSRFGGPGFTNTELKERLLACVLPVSIDDKNPANAGKLGSGYIDAHAAVTVINQKKAPESPKFNTEKIQENSSFTHLTLFWNVPKDEDDGKPTKYALYMSDQALNTNNYMSGKPVGKGIINGSGFEVNDEMSIRVSNLIPDKEYHFAIVAIDRWGIKSNPAIISVKTKKNNPPIISNLPTEPLRIFTFETSKDYELIVSEPDGHKWEYSIQDNNRCVSSKKTEKGIKVTLINGAPAGEYSFKITLKDELNLSTEHTIPFKIIAVKEPEQKMELPILTVGVKNEPITINLADYFIPQEYLPFTYKSESLNGTVASADISEKSKMTIKAYKPGRTTISITVSNGYKSTTVSLPITIVEDSSVDVYSVWPLPMKKDLNIFMNSSYQKARLTLRTVTGEIVLDKQIAPDFSGIAKVNTSSIAPGTYILKVEAGKKPYERTVLKK
ncbi:MAG: S8 family serine peptidase [Porphyromonas sp.]|nr:S8 family serine peptidase [Porphyromonas sp.]